MPKQTIEHLQYLQAQPLNVKIGLTKNRIREWVSEFGTDGVYVSFSGGKDSTVLLHIVRELYPNIPAVFCDTGLEYPEIRQFVKTFDNVVWLKPKMNFFEVCEKYGFPLISKEVSDTVYGARKYLKSVIEDEGGVYHLTDTDMKDCADSASLLKMSGGVRQKIQETPRNWRIYQFEWEKLNGIGRYGKPSNSAKLGGWRSKTLRTPYRNTCLE